MRSSTGAAQPGILSPTRSAAYVAFALIPGSWANRHPHDYILQAFPGTVLDPVQAPPKNGVIYGSSHEPATSAGGRWQSRWNNACAQVSPHIKFVSSVR